MKKPYLPMAEMMIGVAFEAKELSQAAVRMARIMDSGGIVPADYPEGLEKFEEEIADLMLYLEQIPYSRLRVREIMAEKDRTWVRRIEEARAKDGKHGKK